MAHNLIVNYNLGPISQTRLSKPRVSGNFDFSFVTFLVR